MKKSELPIIHVPKTALPIFPLPIFLLPGGVTRLRVFEPRYLKLVSIAIPNHGFVICLNHSNSNIDNINKNQSNVTTSRDNYWGSWVDIINFDQGEDGVLEIDVKCKSLVQIHNVNKDSSNLHFGNMSELQHWSQIPGQVSASDLSTALANVFNDNKGLNNLYPQKSLNDKNWVLARWLEILPIELQVKSAFVEHYSFNEANKFVESVILK